MDDQRHSTQSLQTKEERVMAEQKLSYKVTIGNDEDRREPLAVTILRLLAYKDLQRREEAMRNGNIHGRNHRGRVSVGMDGHQGWR
jgi:hypothetical protein